MAAMDSLYRPELVEERWQRTWEEEGLFAAEARGDGTTYVIAVPPPNVHETLAGAQSMYRTAAYRVRYPLLRRQEGVDCQGCRS